MRPSSENVFLSNGLPTLSIPARSFVGLNSGVLIFAMAKMAELRGQESGGHLLRMQHYVRILAEEA